MSTVRVAVTRLTQTAAPVDPAPSAEAHAAGPRRWWSQRRRPTGLVLALAAGIALAVTVDVFRVHLAGARPAAWRRSTVDWLSDHGPGDLSVTLAGTGCALCGLWLFVLALTPGRRRQLTLAAGSQDWSAAIDRSAVASLLRDAVHDVPGTQNVRVRAGRRRVTVRGEIAFGDCEGARAQARETAARTLADCGLHRPPRLRITLRPAAVWQPPAPRDTAPAPAEAAA
nr:DUF6286 domain-containing protein [Streptomyces sp. SID8379]